MFDIDSTEGDDGLGAIRAEAMKKFPDRIPSRVDFDLEDFDLDGYLPCDLVRLYEYKQELFWDNIAHNIRTNERRPAQVWLTRLMEEFGLTDEYLDKLLFAGQMLQYQAELDAMTDDELEEHMEMQAQMKQAFADTDGLGGVFDQIVERVQREAAERDALEQLWEEGE